MRKGEGEENLAEDSSLFSHRAHKRREKFRVALGLHRLQEITEERKEREES
jgi:hypothetical protein